MNSFSALVMKQVEPIEKFAAFARKVGLGAAVSAKWRGMDTPEKLFELARKGDGEELKRALEAGADVDANDCCGWTAAMFAASNGHGVCLGLLIDGGGGLDAKNSNERTAAMHASINGHRDCLALLEAAGADFDAKSIDGWTAAMFASANGHAGCVGLLMAAGADLEAKSTGAETAAMLAHDNGHPGLASLIDGFLISRTEAAELDLASSSPASGPGRRSMRV